MTQATFGSPAFRSHFPHLDNLAYVASCPQGVFTYEADYALTDLTRSLHVHGAPWGERMKKVEELQRRFADFIHPVGIGGIAFPYVHGPENSRRHPI